MAISRQVEIHAGDLQLFLNSHSMHTFHPPVLTWLSSMLNTLSEQYGEIMATQDEEEAQFILQRVLHPGRNMSGELTPLLALTALS